MSVGELPTLSYRHTPRRAYLRWTLRLLVAAIALVALTYGVRFANKRFKLLSDQRRCLEFTSKSNEVAFDADGTSFVGCPSWNRVEPFVASAKAAKPLLLGERSSVIIVGSPIALHRLIRPDGEARLLVVSCGEADGSNVSDREYRMIARIYKPATLFSVPVLVNECYTIITPSDLYGARYPSDSSFQFHTVEAGPMVSVITGALTNDDTINWSVDWINYTDHPQDLQEDVSRW